MPGLSNQMIDVLTYTEQCFWEDGAIPTNERLHEETGVSMDTIKSYWRSEDFRNALAARGIKFDNTPDSKTLTMKQLIVANMLMNTYDRRSLREKVKDVDVTVQQVNAWMRAPAFQDHLRRRAETMFKGADASAYRGLVQAVEVGDLNAIKLFFEMKGIYNPKVVHEFDITVVLVRVVEIISRHIKDPAILNVIAGEIESLVAAPDTSLPVGF